eukprot:5052556-Amphidinium_carterae.1
MARSSSSAAGVPAQLESVEPEAKRTKTEPAAVLTASWNGEITLEIPDGWDGGETHSSERTGWNCRCTASEVLLDSDTCTEAIGHPDAWCFTAEVDDHPMMW